MVAIPLDSLPLGFRFHPTDEELVNHYLKRKIDGRINSDPAVVIPEVDVCKCEPWDLPDKSLIRSDDPEWFFFSPKDRKYPNGHRSNRATEAGYWKATGKDRIIKSRGRNVIGTKKTLVFHRGRAPKGMRTGWIMHEYRTVEPEFEAGDQGGFVLCRLFKKSEDKSLSLNETRGDDLSPTPTRSSPGDTHTEPDPMEELGTPTDQEFPVLNVLEDQQQLEDKAGCSTVHAQKPGENLCTGNAASDTVTYERQMVAEQGDPVMDDLLQFPTGYDQPDFEGFPQISSPVHPFTDYPFFGNMDLESHIQLFHDDIAEHNSVTEFLGSVLNNLDDYSSEVSSIQGDSVFTSQINVIESVTPMFAWESSECKDIDIQERNNYSSDSKSGGDSVCSSDVDTEVGITKGKEYASSALFYKQPHVSGYPLPVNSHGRSHEIKTQPHNLCQNNDKISLCEKIIPVGFIGDSSAYALSYPLNVDQSVNIIQKKDGFVEDKTKTMTQLDSSPYCLNHPFKTEEMNFNEIEDGSMKNKAMAQLQGHQPVSDPEQSPNQANFIDTKDVLEGTGIRIKSRLPDYRPNSSASIPQQGTGFRRIRFQRKMVKRIPSRRYIQLQKVSSSCNISGGNKDQDVKSQVSKPLERAECYIARETEDECSGDQDEIESFSNQDEPCLTRVDTSQDSEPTVKLRSRGIKYQTANLIGLRTGEVRPEAGSDSHATGRFHRCATWVMPIIIVLLIWLALSWCFLSR